MKELLTNIILVVGLLVMGILAVAAFLGMIFGLMMAIVLPFSLLF